MITKTKIVQIGNSKGIRVPKVLLEHALLPDEVELQAENGRLIVRAAQGPRAGWAKAAKAMHDRGDDQLLDATTSSQFDAKEWRGGGGGAPSPPGAGVWAPPAPPWGGESGKTGRGWWVCPAERNNTLV